MSARLQGALEALYGLERHKSGLGLDGSRRLLEALGSPERRFRAVHVAGTNGKGSVCALVERVLRAAGLSTGLFTSPHLVDFRERIRIGGRWASEAELEARLEHIQGLAAGRGRTFFEVTTALGFDRFAAHAVEWPVVEVGLGGRLDCTNVITPEVAVITGVGLDHTEILGDTLEAVAREKAGIVKPGVPVISGAAGAPAAVIEEVAREKGSPLVAAAARVKLRECRVGPGGTRFEAEAAPWGTLALSLGLRGRLQLENAQVAIAALSVLAERGLEIPAGAVREGIAAAAWPGRLEPCPTEPRLWWDGAHNPQGAERLARAWVEDLGFEPPEAVVLAVSRDKDATAMLRPLAGLAPRARLVVTRTRSERALEPAALRERAAELGWPAEGESDVARALERALGRAGRGKVLLAGSLFAVGEAMEALGGAPGEWL